MSRVSKTIFDATNFSIIWVDESFGKKRWIVPVNYWVGCAGIVIGSSIVVLLFIRSESDTATFLMAFFSGLFFITIGFVVVRSMMNVVNRARVIKRNTALYQVEFWWQTRRSNLEFSVKDIEKVGLCPPSKGVQQWFASLPREPICYQVFLSDGISFLIAGEDEKIHEIIKNINDQGVRVLEIKE